MRIDPICAFEDNYIWAFGNARHVAIVDPGEAAPVFRYLEQRQAALCAILVTHRHADHIGGIEEIRRRFAVPVFGPRREAAEVVSHPLGEGDRIELPELDATFDVLEIPGHTLGHVAFYSAPILFCGDTLFGAGCGRVFEGTLPQMHTSLARLAALPPDTQIYCAHEYTESCLRFARAVEPGNAEIGLRADKVAALRRAGQPSIPSTLADELATNPFLRWRAIEVIKSAGQRLGHPPSNDAETFGAIRIWRDQI